MILRDLTDALHSMEDHHISAFYSMVFFFLSMFAAMLVGWVDGPTDGGRVSAIELFWCVFMIAFGIMSVALFFFTMGMWEDYAKDKRKEKNK